MTSTHIARQWKALCDEFQGARNKAMECFGVVNTAFRGVYEGTGPNPTQQELDAWDAANAHVEDVKKRMSEFVRRNT